MSVANLTRYSFGYPPISASAYEEEYPDSNGEWVKFEEAVEASSNSLQQLKVAKSLLNCASSYIHEKGDEDGQLCLSIDKWLSATV